MEVLRTKEDCEGGCDYLAQVLQVFAMQDVREVHASRVSRYVSEQKGALAPVSRFSPSPMRLKWKKLSHTQLNLKIVTP